MAAIFTQEFYNAWLPDVVGAQIDRADKFLGTAADTFPTQHPMARITKSLFQATHCEVKGKREKGTDLFFPRKVFDGEVFDKPANRAIFWRGRVMRDVLQIIGLYATQNSYRRASKTAQLKGKN